MRITFLLFTMVLTACQSTKPRPDDVPTASNQTPGEVVAATTAADWRVIDPDNTLYLSLPGGRVVIELYPEMAPIHVANTRALVRAGVFDNTSFYRVLDGFVAQGGPLFESEAEQPALADGAYEIAAEFTRQRALPDRYLGFDQQDGYAGETGFLDSAAVGRDLDSGESWLLHCYGALAMGRTNEPDSGGVALYIINGPAQRYLDRNTTVFGRVIDGMAHVQALHRTADLTGALDPGEHNVIQAITVAADVPVEQRIQLQVLDSASPLFQNYLAARKNRSGDWFIHQHDHIDACGVPIPTRIQAD
jgi:peptidylprolyl isomerase